MNNYFVPYTGKEPTKLSINGHQIIMLYDEETKLDEDLEDMGADHLQAIIGSSPEEAEILLTRLANTEKAGIVIVPRDVSLDEVIKNLEVQLPWIQ